MSERTENLARKRRALLAHCAVQRGELALIVDQVEARLEPVDRGINLVRHYATSPLVLSVGVALLAFLGPRRILRWAGRSAFLVSTGRRLLRMLR